MKAVMCGAGIAGLTLAVQLNTWGWDVTVLEKARAPRTQGYMMDFFGPGYDTAEAMGLLPRLRELGYEVTEASFIDDRGRRRAALTYAQFTREAGGRLLSIMRPDLEKALREALSENVELRYGTSIERVENTTDGVRLILTGGDSPTADLLVGADGIHSTVRALVHGDESSFLHYLGYHTAAYVFDDFDIHDEVGDRFCLTDTLHRQMGFYALRDGRVAAFAVHRAPEPGLPLDVRAALRREYASLGWIVPSALDRCPPAAEVYYDQVAQIRMPYWGRGRVTLVGDACQAVSLLAGQGASLAMAGAYVLAEQLARQETIEAALECYERLWRPVVEEKQLVGRKAARWFVPESPLALHSRRVMLRLSQLPGAGRLITAGLAGKPTALIKELRADTP